MNDRELHAHLIGQQGGRQSFNTPVLVIDLDVLERNIRSMADFAGERGIALAASRQDSQECRHRPPAGRGRAGGVCCAKLGEAEAMADGGVDGILDLRRRSFPPPIERLIALNQRIGDLRVTVDNPDNIDALAAIASGKRLQVLIDIDPGIRRNYRCQLGLNPPPRWRRRSWPCPRSRYIGVQYYCGREQHIGPYAERRAAIEDRTAYLKSVSRCTDSRRRRAVRHHRRRHRNAPDRRRPRSVHRAPVGSYVFMDRQYNECDLTELRRPIALHRNITVHRRPRPSAPTPRAWAPSTPASRRVSHRMAARRPSSPGAPADAKVSHFMGDEHGAVVSLDNTAKSSKAPALFWRLPHCDPTVNLYDFYHVVRGDTLVDIWPVQARGRSR